MNYIPTDRGFEAENSYRENCKKCSGRGRFIGYSGRDFGKCFACKGVGYKEFKTAPQERAQNRQRAAERRVRSTLENLEFFKTNYPDALAWMHAQAGRFEFAQKMLDTVCKYGELTDGQHAAVTRCMERDAARNAERAQAAQAREAAAPAVSTDRLMAAFDNARSAGLKRLKMRFVGFEASPAKADSANPGAIYVKDGGLYLGKVMNGKFLASRDCSPETAERVARVMSDPLAEAVAYGRETGSCCCCGRELTDPVSVENGIGPICAANFGL